MNRTPPTSARSQTPTPSKTPIPLTLPERRHEYGTVYTYRFARPAGVTWRAGQFAHLVAPGRGVSRDTVRHMSIASAPGDDDLCFSMTESSGSRYKRDFSALTPGQPASVFGIAGAFTIDPETQPAVLFVAGGVGMTPVRSLVRCHGDRIRWQLVHVARDGHLYEQELRRQRAPQYRVGRAGAVHAIASAITSFRAEGLEPDVYVSGGHGFVEAMASRATTLGIPDTRIRVEDFTDNHHGKAGHS